MGFKNKGIKQNKAFIFFNMLNNDQGQAFSCTVLLMKHILLYTMDILDIHTFYKILLWHLGHITKHVTSTSLIPFSALSFWTV